MNVMEAMQRRLTPALQYVEMGSTLAHFTNVMTAMSRVVMDVALLVSSKQSALSVVGLLLLGKTLVSRYVVME